MLIVLFVFSGIAPCVHAADDSWTTGDKFLHAGVAGGVSFVSYNLYKKTTKMDTVTAKLAAFATAVAAGALKEAIDGEFSEKDFIADAIGGGIGAAIAFEF